MDLPLVSLRCTHAGSGMLLTVTNSVIDNSEVGSLPSIKVSCKCKTSLCTQSVVGLPFACANRLPIPRMADESVCLLSAVQAPLGSAQNDREIAQGGWHVHVTTCIIFTRRMLMRCLHRLGGSNVTSNSLVTYVADAVTLTAYFEALV